MIGLEAFLAEVDELDYLHWEEVEEVGSVEICQDNLRKCEEKRRGSWQNNLRD